jgi:hypothetical protein
LPVRFVSGTAAVIPNLREMRIMFPPTSVLPGRTHGIHHRGKTFAMKTICVASLGIVLSVAVLCSQARAIEMFTNFNDGMELGYRPLGVPDFAPVRFHSHQPQRWYTRHGMVPPSDDMQFSPPPSPPTAVPGSSMPGTQWQDGAIELRSEPAAGVASLPAEHEDVDWLRGQSFLPLDSKN